MSRFTFARRESGERAGPMTMIVSRFGRPGFLSRANFGGSDGTLAREYDWLNRGSLE
jgi:hypothetical protein